jgi:hypothetical protein
MAYYSTNSSSIRVMILDTTIIFIKEATVLRKVDIISEISLNLQSKSTPQHKHINFKQVFPNKSFAERKLKELN